MENTYYREMIDAQNSLGIANKRISELTELNLQLETDVKSMKVEFQMLRLELQENVNEIVELRVTDEDDCPCGGDCSCKGDDYEDYENILP